MKIALCLSGLPRSSMFCYPYIYDAFMNNDYDIDVYIHAWSMCRAIDLYNPKKILIENDTLKLIEIKNEISEPSHEMILASPNSGNTLQMFYSIKKCFDLIEGEYDFVIRSRFDLFIQEKFNLKEIINELNSTDNDIYIPFQINNHISNGLNDQIAIGKFEKMKIYSNLYSNLKDIINKSLIFRAENFLETHMIDNKMKIIIHFI